MSPRNTATNTITGVGDFPEGITVSPNGSTAYVTNATGDTVSVINTATNTVTGTIGTGSGADAVAISPDGSHLYVTNEFDGTVSIITR